MTFLRRIRVCRESDLRSGDAPQGGLTGAVPCKAAAIRSKLPGKALILPVIRGVPVTVDWLLYLLGASTSIMGAASIGLGAYALQCRRALVRQKEWHASQLNDLSASLERASRQQMDDAEEERRILAAQLESARASHQDVLKQHRNEVALQRDRLEKNQVELRQRLKLEEMIYRIVVIGASGTGKSSLIIKWANPLWEQKKVWGTSNWDLFKRTVSSVVNREAGVIVNHTFEVYDYGGERVVAAQNAMVQREIHGLLFVVDLAKDTNPDQPATGVDPVRVAAQLEEFNPAAIRFFFEAPEILKTLGTVVLFINKSDLISGTPREIESEAMRLFDPLIQTLRRYPDIQIDIMVGSAAFGHNTHTLMPHFVRKLLPADAYDVQLVQGQQRRPDGA